MPVSALSKFFRERYQACSLEIYTSRSLQLYGAALAFTHILTVYFWRAYPAFNEPAICWPVFSHCEWLAFLYRNSTLTLALYLAISASAFCAFIFRRVGLATGLLAAAFILKSLFILSDYRMMGNYHYMSLLLQVTFLMLPEKKRVLRLLIALFYLAAGSLKFNSDWLSGQAFPALPYLTGTLLKIACAYVVVLEMLIAPFILSRNRHLRLFALCQLLVFHAFSWNIVGYFYPLTMFAILTIFFLVDEKFEWPERRPAMIFIGLVCAFQFYPALFEPNSSLNGRGRILALNMFDARSECETRFFLRYRKRMVEYVPTFPNFGLRIHCDPVVILHHAQQTCADQKTNLDFLDLDVDHQSRRISQPEVIEQFTYAGVCARPPRVSPLGAIQQ